MLVVNKSKLKRQEKERKSSEKNQELLKNHKFMIGYQIYENDHDGIFALFQKANLIIGRSQKPTSRIWLLVRSIYFQHIRLFKESLRSIHLAEQYGAPKELVQQRRKEVQADQKKMEYDGDLWKYFKLSFEANEKIPSLANCLKLEENEEFGKHIVTTRELKAGDIVGISEPFFKSFCLAASCYRCSYCQRSNNMDLVDCERCAQGEFCNIYSPLISLIFRRFLSDVLRRRVQDTSAVRVPQLRMPKTDQHL